jgi:hypothetical protein
VLLTDFFRHQSAGTTQRILKTVGLTIKEKQCGKIGAKAG